jgi:beta-galactosidase
VKPIFFRSIAVCAALAALVSIPASAAQARSPRLVLSADSGWKFDLGNPSGAQAPGFADQSWRTVSLPHDWSIEAVPDEKSVTGSGEGFYPGGIGWYRKTFTAPAAWKGKRVSVEFDGVYKDATVYLNGHELGTHPYGYTSFSFDLTPDLDFSGTNVLAVRVDNSAQPNSRWYSGSGIYRHVRVVVADPTHVAHWGVFVTTPEASASTAKVSLHTRVVNESTEQSDVTVQTTLIDHAGKQAGRAQSTLTIAPGADAEATQEVAVVNPTLWSPRSPTMYRAVTRVLQNGKVVDEVSTPFGIRSLSWSVEKGLLLNGKSIKLVGGSVHHDNGPLGAAAFDRAEERRVELLKAAGFNAVRTAHNPPSPAFLDACDRLGLLVLDEPFDVWTEHKVKYDYASDFNEWWQRDIDSMVMRDRNHPSIIFWGIGNEIPEAWTPKGAPIARKLAAEIRSLDSTRPLTEAFPGATYTPSTDAVFAVLDVGGYNYNLAQNQAKDHERVPGRIMMTTESMPAAAFENWQLAHQHPYILGEFVWTAMDYLGESGIGSWAYATPQEAAQADQVAKMMQQMMPNMGADGKNPFAGMAEQNDKPNPIRKLLFPGYPWHAADSGDLDLTGFRKPQSYYRDILWHGGDRVYATVRVPAPDGKKIVAMGWAVYPTLPSWTWPGQEGKNMEVEVYSGTEKVQLFLNGKLIGEKPTGSEQEFRAMFTVPYAPGTLKAVGIRSDRTVAESILTTVGKPVRLRLTADRSVLKADGQDLSFVTVEALDAEGRLEQNADQEVHFALTGAGLIAAVGNGDGQDDASYQGDQRKLFHGRALVVVRTSTQAGSIHLTAATPGLHDGAVDLQSKPANLGPQLQ